MLPKIIQDILRRLKIIEECQKPEPSNLTGRVETLETLVASLEVKNANLENRVIALENAKQ